MEGFTNSDLFGLWIAITVVFIILVLWNVILHVKLTKVRKKFLALMGDTGVEDLPNVMQTLHQGLEQLEQIQKDHAKQLTQIHDTLAKLKGNVGVVRYNAFANTGSDLSFSVAFVDQAKDGVVISGIHNREFMFMYAKPLENGESSYSLTAEEKEAIHLALPSR